MPVAILGRVITIPQPFLRKIDQLFAFFCTNSNEGGSIALEGDLEHLPLRQTQGVTFGRIGWDRL